MWCSLWCSSPPCSERRVGSVMRKSLDSSIPADQIEQREQEDPDDVDEVPVEAEVFDICNVAGGVCPCLGPEEHEGKNADADDHVQSVHAGHGEVEEEVLFRLLRHVVGQRLILRVLAVNLGIRSRIGERLDAVVEAGDVMLLDLLAVFDGLDAQEGHAQNPGESQKKQQGTSLAHLR